MKIFLQNILLTASLLPLQGCFFTGVESTPRITGKDVKREVPPPTVEDSYLASVGDAPFSSWEPGKTFIVTDDRIGRIFGASATSAGSLKGSVIRYSGTREAVAVTGGTVSDIIFTSPTGLPLTYRINKSQSRLMADSVIEIPFTIQMSVIEDARRLLQGKEFYILTSLWRNDDDEPIWKGRKFIPVRIDSVSPGNALFPIKIAFTDPDGNSGRVFIHPGAKGDAPRTFSRVFSFTDPRLRYPHITPEHWQMIIDGRVTEGMTLEECRLSLGAPKEIDRGATNSYIREAWLYENGVYLLFEDGLLKRYRH